MKKIPIAVALCLMASLFMAGCGNQRLTGTGTEPATTATGSDRCRLRGTL